MLLGLVSALAVSAGLACGNTSTQPPGTTPSTPSATPSGTVVATASPQATPTPSPTPQARTFHLLYREFGQTADTIWRVDPLDASRREKLATISHAVGSESFISLSSQGDTIAYTALPEGALDERTNAQAWALDLEGGRPRLLAQGVNLLIRPLWSPDGRFVYLRRNQEGFIAILQVGLEGGRGKVVLQQPAGQVNELIPIGFAPDGDTLYYVQVGATSQTGVFLGAVDAAGGEGAVVMRLSEEAARDFTLSPNGRRLAFSSQTVQGGTFILRSFLADIAARSVVPLAAPDQASGAQLHPIWYPSGEIVSVGQPPLGKPGAVANVPLAGGQASLLSPPEKGFDIPLSWAPDGSFLAVRSFAGDSLSNPGPARLVLVSPDGRRVPLAEGSGAEPIGWVSQV